MTVVQLRVARQVLEELLCLGDRTIFGVSMAPAPGGTAINEVAVFLVNAPDAPDGVTEMSPTFTTTYDESRPAQVTTMLDPGWR